MVHVSNPFHSFKPKWKGPAPFPEFQTWEPSTSYLKEEQAGLQDWKGPNLEAIPTKTITPATPPLKSIFGDLFDRLWVKASTPTGPQQQFLAQTRQQRPCMPAPAPYRPMVSPMNPPGVLPNQADKIKHLTSMANDWELHQQLERFTGYAFRGDGRDPGTIKAAGGFKTSSTRTDDHFIKNNVYGHFCGYMQRRFQKDLKATMSADQFLQIVNQSTKTPEAREVFNLYTTWRMLAKSEELHLGRMLADETLKAYISTTRAVPVAKGFAKSGGWVYCVAVLGGFIVPEKFKHEWTKIFGEQEIAKHGGFGWQNIAAARKVGPDKKFIGDLYMRHDFETIDPKAFEAIFKLMSGKKQG